MTVAARFKHGLPVVDRWFSALEVTETLTVISEPYVHPFLRANIWHLRGRDRDLIVDSGLGIARLSDELPRLFQRDPVVAITHAHLLTSSANAMHIRLSRSLILGRQVSMVRSSQLNLILINRSGRSDYLNFSYRPFHGMAF